MSQHIYFQRFRRDESCTEEGCRARKFYIEDGKKFCQRGHEQEGFTQTQQDEDDWNAQGKKSRKRKEEKERVETVFSGNEAKELYLHCYQLILWKQCHWLVTTLGIPDELRVIVKDLWELRIRALHFSRDEKNSYGSGTGTMMFSSAMKIDWGKWMKATTSESPEGFVKGEEIRAQDSDVWNMNADKLDDYMDWYQNTWIDDRNPKSEKASRAGISLRKLLQCVFQLEVQLENWRLEVERSGLSELNFQ
ncbi:hypothetical protein JHW43_007006 [Diplocarpon mali]|nr:hypothetical protein JHW43_007006 [Diplocarpon mali]